MMKVLIACEFSGIVREAFRRAGHDAWSCDILPTEIPGQHIQADVLTVLDQGWDLMIAHPPCTYLSTAGNRHLHTAGRTEKRQQAFEFFMLLYNASIPKIAVENPVGFVSTLFRKPDQIIHPYYFGDPHVKRTCLWLKGLPVLTYDHSIPKPEPLNYIKSGKNKGKALYFASSKPSLHHELDRSRTFPGIADAMAKQWSPNACVSISTCGTL